VQSVLARARARAVWFAVVFFATVTACGKDVVNPDGTTVESVQVTPASASLQVGASLSLTAEVYDATGAVIPSAGVTWSSEHSSIAVVSQSGIITALRTGTVRIAASSWGKNAVATITVNPALTVLPAVGRIVIAPSNPRINEGQTIRLTASVLDIQDRVITGLTITWSSSNPSRATVDNSGLVRGISSGTVTITAFAGGKTGSTTVRVER
jgi:uncharacterized protein YjdB